MSLILPSKKLLYEAATAGLAKGVEVNDKDYLDRFPFLAPAHQGLLQGHGGTNTPTVPTIPIP